MASGSSSVVIKAFAANLGIAIAKFVAAGLTRSSAMLSEAVHSLADAGNQLLLLLGMKRSKRAEDERHEFGYSSERYFWAFIVAVSLFTMGATFSIYEGVEKILHPSVPRNPLPAYIVLGVSIVLEMFSMHAAIVEFRHLTKGRGVRQTLNETRDSVIVVVLFEDGAALLGLVLALIGVTLTQFTGNSVFDGIASICVGLTLFGVATFLALKTKRLLIGEAVTAADRKRIVDLAEAAKGVRKVVHLRTLHLGPEDVIVAMKIAFDDAASAREIAAHVDSLEATLRQAIPYLKRIYVEVGTVEAPGTAAG
jgi:cation diffusion facilitator family transporter